MPFMTSSDDVRLHWTDDGSGPTVALVGGYLMAETGWGLQRDALAGDHRVLGLDRRSHGASEHVLRGRRMARHARDVEELLAGIGASDVVLMGASMGANTIWSYVELFGTARLRGIVAVDQTPKMVNDEGWSLGMYDLTGDTVEHFVATFPGGHNPFHTMPSMELIQTMRDASVEPPVADLQALLRDHAWADWRDVLPLVHVPVLTIAGRHSPVWPCESSEYVAATVPDGRCVVLEQSGHVPFLEEPEAFNDALRRWLAEL